MDTIKCLPPKSAKALQPFTDRIPYYIPDICTRCQDICPVVWRQIQAEAVNPCKGLQTPCHHGQLSRSSGAVKLWFFFPSLIASRKPQIPMHHCGFILSLLIFILFTKALVRSLCFTLLSCYLLGNIQIPPSPQHRGKKIVHLSSGKQSLAH